MGYNSERKGQSYCRIEDLNLLSDGRRGNFPRCSPALGTPAPQVDTPLLAFLTFAVV